MGSVEIVKDKETKESFDLSFAGWVTDACTRRGVLLRACTGGGIRVAFCPPLIIEEPEVDMLFDRWELALDDTLEHVRAEGWM